MRSFPAETVPDGDYTTPHEFNAEVGELAAGMHSVDHDNFAAHDLTTDTLEPGAMGGFLIDGHDGPVTNIHTDDSQIGDIYPIPTDAGVPWVITTTVGDCKLIVSLSAAWVEATRLLPSYVWVGLRVNGEVVVRSGTTEASTFAYAPFVEAHVELGAGTVVVEPIYGMHPGDAPFARDIQWQERSLALLEQAR